MKKYSKSELIMWEKPIKRISQKSNDQAIDEKYRLGELRIVTETNREKIPNFVLALTKPDYMEVRPFYQRRTRWDLKRQSRLIESFVMNIPVPPLFLYEKDYNKYEVMDGQQRITALKGFYNGEYKLSGLEMWPELNGRTYSTLPSQVRQGLNRRSISYIVVLKESTPEEEDAIMLRQTVFERLNTGGVKLEHQEIRNSLFQGKLNDLLIELTQLDQFRYSFKMPKFKPDEDNPNAPIRKKTLYEKMGDAELVLRFFALRHTKYFTKGMQGFLDLFMSRARLFTERDVDYLRDLFEKTIELAVVVYEDKVFCPYNFKTDVWDKSPTKAFYDAVMVGISEFIDERENLVKKREKIIEDTKNLFIKHPEGTFTGRANTKKDVEQRINKFKEMLRSNLN